MSVKANCGVGGWLNGVWFHVKRSAMSAIPQFAIHWINSLFDNEDGVIDITEPQPRGLELSVPFVEHRQVKALGGWFDAARKKWFVPPGEDPKKFADWLPAVTVYGSLFVIRRTITCPHCKKSTKVAALLTSALYDEIAERRIEMDGPVALLVEVKGLPPDLGLYLSAEHNLRQGKNDSMYRNICDKCGKTMVAGVFSWGGKNGMPFSLSVKKSYLWERSRNLYSGRLDVGSHDYGEYIAIDLKYKDSFKTRCRYQYGAAIIVLASNAVQATIENWKEKELSVSLDQACDEPAQNRNLGNNQPYSPQHRQHQVKKDKLVAPRGNFEKGNQIREQQIVGPQISNEKRKAYVQGRATQEDVDGWNWFGGSGGSRPPTRFKKAAVVSPYKRLKLERKFLSEGKLTRGGRKDLYEITLDNLIAAELANAAIEGIADEKPNETAVSKLKEPEETADAELGCKTKLNLVAPAGKKKAG